MLGAGGRGKEGQFTKSFFKANSLKAHLPNDQIMATSQNLQKPFNSSKYFNIYTDIFFEYLL